MEQIFAFVLMYLALVYAVIILATAALFIRYRKLIKQIQKDFGQPWPDPLTDPVHSKETHP